MNHSALAGERTLNMYSFRTQLAALMAGFVLLTAVALAWVVGNSITEEVGEQQGQALRNLARGIASIMGQGLDERFLEVARLANGDLFPYARSSSAVTDQTLERIAAARTHYSWIGVTSPTGKVLSATRGMLVGASVAERPWFQHGLNSAYTGDVHKAKLLASLLPPSTDGAPTRFIDFSAPLTDATGRVIGVLGTHVNWDWARDIIRLLRSQDVRQQGVLVYVVGADGTILLQPKDEARQEKLPTSLLQATPHMAIWPDGGKYLTAAAALAAEQAPNRLGWTIVVRQPANVALGPAQRARRAVWWVGLGIAFVAACWAWKVAGRFSLPLSDMASAARRLAEGELRVALPPPSGVREVRTLSRAMSSMLGTLNEREQDLREANRRLESRVLERTQALASANAELTRLARHDALTGLPNRRAADEQIAAEIARHRRSGQSLTVLVFDIDHFKRVNDTHGHAAGDAVLAQVARTAQTTLRSTDFVARTGGEEFLVLLPETEEAGAQAAAEKLRAAIALQQFDEAGHVSVSVGRVSDAQAFADAPSAIRAADTALYAAKHAGRNRVERYQPPNTSAPADAKAGTPSNLTIGLTC